MKIFAEVQKIGKALMTPVAILPAAGLFLAFGNKLHFTLMEQAGQIIFSNLPLLFAIGASRWRWYCRSSCCSSYFDNEYYYGNYDRCCCWSS